MLKNIGANWLQLIVSIAVAYYLTPFTLHTLGRDLYGTWLLITSITGYLSLLAMGLPMASVRFVAKHANDPDADALNRAVANSTGLSLVFGFVALVAGLAAFAFFATYRIPVGSQFDARLAFVIVVANTAFGFVGQIPIAILAAYDDFVTQNKILVASLLMRLGFLVILLRLHPTLVLLAVSLTLSLAFELIASVTIIGRRYPRIRPRLHHLDWLTVRRIVGFSIYVLILGAGAQLSFQTDAIVIGKLIEVDAIPFFSSASLLTIYLMQLVIGVAAVVMPAAARLHALGISDTLGPLLLKWSKVCLSLTLAVAPFLLVAGPQFLGWWLGRDFVGPGGTVLRILTVGSIVFLPVRGVAVPILMGVGNPRVPALGFAAAGALNLLLSIVWARPFGLVGVALATILPNALFAVLLLHVVCRNLRVSVRQYLSYVVSKPVIGTIPVMASLYLSTVAFDLDSFTGLCAAGALSMTVFGLTWILFVYRDDPFFDPARLLMTRLRGRVSC
jgi:O-antigen/teichoic acid export membrane protein